MRVLPHSCPGSSGARNSTAWAPASSSIARARSEFASDLPRLQSRGIPHRDVIFLARARRDRVHARRMAQRLVLAHQSGCDVLRDHEARVQSAVHGEERRQAVGQVRIDETLHPALRDVRELRAAAIANASSANASGCPWKLPFETSSSSSTSTSGLSVAEFSSDRNRAFDVSRADRATPRAPAVRSAASRRPAPCRTTCAPR